MNWKNSPTYYSSKSNASLATGRYIAAGIAVLAMLLFPICEALAKSLANQVPAVVIVWVRFFGSAVLITPIYLRHLRKNPQFPAARSVVIETLRALIIIVAFGSFITSFRTIPFSEAMTYYSFAPIVAATLSVWILKEKMTQIKMFALVLGLAGVTIALNPRVSPETGAYFAILTGALYGSYLFLNRVVAIRWHPIQALFLQFWIGSVLLLWWVWPYLNAELLVHVPKLAGIAGVSVICNIMLINAFRLAEASFLAPFIYVEIPSALVISVIFFNETLSWNLLLGAGMILCAGLLVVMRDPNTPAHKGA